MAEQLISTSTAEHDRLPDSYVRPETQRRRLRDVVPDADIPVVDLADPDRAAVVARVAEACRTHGHGFFQVLNHGVPEELRAAMMSVAYEFFRLPAEEKAKLYSDDPPARKIRLSTSFNFNARKETVRNWRDYLRLHCHPLDQFVLVPDWPSSSNPPDFKDTMRTYRKEIRELGFRLFAAISDSLGLDMKQTLGDQDQHVVAVNLYPQCPEPELTSGGLPAHALTIFLMDQDVAGLQVLHAGKWVAVNPRPGALLVSIGDQLRALEKRSIDAAVFQREPGARPLLGENRAAAALGQGVPDPDGIASIHTLLCHSDGLLLPLESIVAAGETFLRSSRHAALLQVRVDESVAAPIVPRGVGAKATGEDDRRNNGRHGSRENLLGILGIMAGSLAITAAVPAVAGVITPAMAFGSAVLMFTGVSMAMASIRGA